MGVCLTGLERDPRFTLSKPQFPHLEIGSIVWGIALM